ncbi:tetratricopeptide repeat protein [Luteolibacter algae]|uniref:Tetratricopeptide repeat protein n=2 Tax=Luteolibacter algae TaxID=454151 RepID=A0ABW5DFH6_9BACT
MFIFHSAVAETAEDLLVSANHAMDDGLWDVASMKLNDLIGSSELAPQQQVQALILLAESLIRDNRPVEASRILEMSLVREHPEAAFWAAQALASQGRFTEAVNGLLPIAGDPEHRYRKEAAFTAASLQLSLSESNSALSTLKLLAEDPSLDTRVEAQLKRIEILIDQERYDEARDIFPEIGDIPEKLIQFANLLNGYLTLAEGDADSAEIIFTNLLSNPTGQTLANYNLAAVGKADALSGQGKAESATDSLLNFIQSNPDTTMLEPMFRRITEWLPEKIISTDNPILIRLRDWLPRTSPYSNSLINLSDPGAAAAWPETLKPISDLGIFSMHAYGIALRRLGTTTAKKEAEHLMQRIQLLAPQHFLAPQALLTLAEWKLNDGETEDAFAIYDSLRMSAKSPLVKGEAAFQDARIAFDSGNPELAAELFAEASATLTGKNREMSVLNAALSRLKMDPAGTYLIQNEEAPISTELTADLALERALLNSDPEAAKFALDDFLRNNPEHPRANEARLAIVQAALAVNPADISMARAQLDTLRIAEPPLPPHQIPQLEIAELHLLDHAGESEKVVSLAKEIIKNHQGSTAASDAALILGKTLFKTGSYNEARLVLEKLASSEISNQRAQAALLLAARSAALGATAQSREEALALFDKTIAMEGPLTSLAMLEKARLNIDLNQLPVAIQSLSEAYSGMSEDDPSRLPTGLLLAEAIYAQGDTKPESLNRALKIYNELLTLSADNPAQYFRLQYLRGRTLEKLPESESSDKGRLGDAISAYFSVLDRPTDPPPPEWEWFERSGFRALSLLENAERWRAAIAIAEKIASFKGPRAEEASTRARQLRLKHMIWED